MTDEGVRTRHHHQPTLTTHLGQNDFRDLLIRRTVDVCQFGHRNQGGCGLVQGNMREAVLGEFQIKSSQFGHAVFLGLLELVAVFLIGLFPLGLLLRSHVLSRVRGDAFRELSQSLQVL